MAWIAVPMAVLGTHTNRDFDINEQAAFKAGEGVAGSTGEDKLEQPAMLLLLVIGLLLYLPWLGSYGPIDPTDSFFIEGSRELLETQQYLLPMFNYQVWLDKPILYFWMVVGCYKLIGVSPFAGRMASALSAVFTGLIIYRGGSPALGFRQAFLASLIFLSFPLCSVIGHESLTDMPLTMFMTAALFGFYNYRRSRRPLHIVLAYLALGLAFLCKGPVSLVIVGAIVFLHLLCTTSFTSRAEYCKAVLAGIWSLKPLLGLLIMAAVNLPWYTLATLQTRGRFLVDFFITQNFGRMVGTVNHIEPFWYYIPVVLGGLFPLSLVLFSNFDALKSFVRQRTRVAETHGFYFFSLVWAAFILLLFGAIKTKLATYILPAMPPLAILTAATMAHWVKFAPGKLKALWPGAAIFILAGVAGLICSFVIGEGWVKTFLIEQRYLLVLTVLVGLAYLNFVLKNRPRAAFSLVIASAVVGAGLAVPLGHKVFYREVHKPFEACIMRVIKERGQIATVVTEEPSISYFLHRHIDVISTPEQAKHYLNEKGEAGSRHFLLVPKKCLRDMEWFPSNAQKLDEIHRWVFFRLD